MLCKVLLVAISQARLGTSWLQNSSKRQTQCNAASSSAGASSAAYLLGTATEPGAGTDAREGGTATIAHGDSFVLVLGSGAT